jgi:hypothetical protein
MPVAQAGIAFRTVRPVGDAVALVGRLFDGVAEELPRPTGAGFDVRQRGDVMLQTFGDVCFVCNLDFGCDVIDDPHARGERLHAALGSPEFLMAYCHDEVRERYAYAVYARGRPIRARAQALTTRDAADRTNRLVRTAPPTALRESGAPLSFERRWLAAPHFMQHVDDPAQPTTRVFYLGDREVLVPESRLTGRLLHDGLTALFGVCPWDTLITPGYRFFRMRGAQALASTPGPAEEAAAPKRRAWWRRGPG